MGPSNRSYLSYIASFHFHDSGKKSSFWGCTIPEKINWLFGDYFFFWEGTLSGCELSVLGRVSLSMEGHTNVKRIENLRDSIMTPLRFS